MSRFIDSLLVASVLFLVSLKGYATVTVTPANGGNAVNGNVYYGVSTLSSSVLLDPQNNYFKLIDMTLGQDHDVNRANLLLFDVVSNKSGLAAANGQILAIMVSAKQGTGSAGSKFVPIATVGSASCAEMPCQNRKTNIGENGGHFFSVPYAAGQTLRVGLYAKDICADYTSQANGGIAFGCEIDSKTGTVTPSSGAKTIQLTFAIQSTDGTNDPTTTALDAIDLNLNFQAEYPVLSCNTTDIYFPQDSAIAVDTTKLGITSSLGATGTTIAPADALIVVANQGKAANISADFATLNTVVSYAGMGGNQNAGPFTNTTNGTDQKYNVAFMVRNAAGMIATQSACSVNDVQTSEVQGFLQKSKCFIATAAFRSIDAPPVTLLRELRDDVLFESEWGTRFVKAYYRWSPPAAEWLMDHPEFRFPVLSLLAPIEAFAWIVLHPLLMRVLIALGLLLLSVGCASSRVSPSTKQSDTPYIDQIKEQLREEDRENPAANTTSYIETRRAELLQEEKENPDSLKGGSYMESLKAADPESFKTDHAGSYTELERAKLPSVDNPSAIEALRAGKSELEMKRSLDISGAYGFRMGAKETFNITAAAGTGLRSFSDVYGSSGWAPDLSLYYEFQPFHSEWWGSLGFFGMGGMSYFKGYGAFQFALNNPTRTGQSFAAQSQVFFQFFSFPVSAGLNYRFNLMRILRPYVMAGPAAVGYLETRNDSKPNMRGYSFSVLTTGGVALLLDWISPSSTWDLYAERGIKHYYITIEYSRLNPLSGEVKYASSGIVGGLAFEY